MRRFIAATLGVALTVTLTVTVLVFAPAPAAHAWTVGKYQGQVVQSVNNRRAERNRVRLKQDRCLQRFATRHARRMADRHRMYHQDLRVVLRRCGLRRVGENVAYGYPNGWGVVKSGWMKSRSHRLNLLDSRHRRIAVGARRGGGVWYVSALFARR